MRKLYGGSLRSGWARYLINLLKGLSMAAMTRLEQLSVSKMTSALTTSFLATVLSSSEFKFRSKRVPATKCCGELRIASSMSSSTSMRASAATSIEESLGIGTGALCGRRGLVFLAALPYLVPPCANPAESSGGDCLIMKQEIAKVLTKGKASGVLRLVFHDAGTFDMIDNSGGMNGSIIFELNRPENKGLNKSLKIIKKAKSEADKIRPDMIAVAGAEAVSLCGGPTIPVRLGRLDATKADPEGKLPEETLNASGLKRCFEQKGFSVQDLVALSGAHTLGSKGFGNPTVFDNSYYKILTEKPWLNSGGMTNMIGLPSDRALVDDDECLRWIEKYAKDESSFFRDFSIAYTKLVNSGARWNTA